MFKSFRFSNRIILIFVFFFCGLFFLPNIFGESLEGTSEIISYQRSLDWQGYLTIFLALTAFILMVKELRPPDEILLVTALILVIFNIITPQEFLTGFSQDIIITITFLCIIVKALEVNGVLDIILNRLTSDSKDYKRQLMTFLFPIAGASAFLNNTPIILLFAPAVRSWARQNKVFPSKFLIPISYIAILGGSCSLIGSSTNLIIDGLLRREFPNGGLGFFELAWLGVPCTIIGFVYLLFLGNRLLPNRVDPGVAVAEEAKELTGEFLVEEGCELVGTTLIESGKKHFIGEVVIEIERGNQLMDSPSPYEVILAGDRLVFAGDIKHIAQLHSIKGLKSSTDPHFTIDVGSPHFSEVVLSVMSFLIGKTVKQSNFRANYGASILAIYREGKRIEGDIGEIVFQAGDTLMLLSKGRWRVIDSYSHDFYYVRNTREIVLYKPWKTYLVICCVLAMVFAALFNVPIMMASLAVTVIFFFSGCISFNVARQSISWDIIVLIASGFSLAVAMQNTGVANYLAENFLFFVGSNPYVLVGSIFFITMVITEFVTNNAAAMLVFPIAIQVARLAGFTSPESIKAIGIAVAVGATFSFATPIGYQTNTIVYGQGGYKFSDYMKIGIPLSFVLFLFVSFVLPRVWVLG